MAHLNFERRGAGEPLVLVHGLGSSLRVWDPLIPALADRFDVLTIDLPGFGDSASLPTLVVPTPARLAESVAGLLDDLGIKAPHVVGNSLGGWVGLELARTRRLASLTLLSPAGLWTARTPLYSRASLRASRWLARHAGGLLSRLMGSAVGRVLVLGQTHGRPWRLTPDQARITVRALGESLGFAATLDATVDRHYLAEPSDRGVPVTVAFGSRDFVLLGKQSRRVDRLPAGTRVVSLPGCGHIPTHDDPEAVARLVTEAASTNPEQQQERRQSCRPTTSTPT